MKFTSTCRECGGVEVRVTSRTAARLLAQRAADGGGDTRAPLCVGHAMAVTDSTTVYRQFPLSTEDCRAWGHHKGL